MNGLRLLPLDATGQANGLRRLCVREDATILQAMAAIDSGGLEICCVLDARGRLAGVATDGDLRRAILGGATLDAPLGDAINRTMVTVLDSVSRDAVMDLMQSRHVSQIPVVDSDGELVGMHLLRNYLQRRELAAAALILAGGKGTRLGELTRSLPKPMLRVAGRPILERLVLQLVGSGVRTIYLSVSYMAEAIVAHFGDGSDYGCRIVYLYDDPGVALGTGGPLLRLPTEEMADARPVILLNGDLVCDFEAGSLVASHQDAQASASVGVVRHAYVIPFGVVAAEGGVISDIVEKPEQTWQVNAGIYLFEKSVIASARARITGPVTAVELISEEITAGHRVAVWPVSGAWSDIGRPDELESARGWPKTQGISA